MKGVQCYELFGGIALKIHTIHTFFLFNADDHNINDLKVCILKGNFKDNEHRKLTELQFIINFETNKFGFNKDIFSSVHMIFLSIKVKYFQLQCNPFLAVILSYTCSYRH